MGKHTIRTKDLSKIGYVNDVSRSIAIGIIAKHFKHASNQDILTILTSVKENPQNYISHPELGTLALTFTKVIEEDNFEVFELQKEEKPLKIFGNKLIEGNAKRQMELALQLPISLQGALMPDAHVGFGLPVGGVLATRNAVIPYAVGVDIGCRMALSIFDLPEKYLQMNQHALKTSLKEFTHFGMEGALDFTQEHEVLDHKDFTATELLRKLHGKAIKQLGSSGGGNHFVEFGILELQYNNALKVPEGKYVALMTHSGSRGLGANIAKHYTKIAMDTCKLPKHAQQLAWLSLDSEAGQEYWLSMNLAGEYAKACHDQIHKNLSKAMGEKIFKTIENHHNFAWEEELSDGTKGIVHRKGATPAHLGEFGIIPGSMTTGCYIVAGKGNSQSLNSSSHGAGRRFSRSNAKDSFTTSAMKKILSTAGVHLIGGSTEECPLAYKDIESVMREQETLISIEGKFTPKIVRMNKE